MYWNLLECRSKDVGFGWCWQQDVQGAASCKMKFWKRLKTLKNDQKWSLWDLLSVFSLFQKFHFPACSTLIMLYGKKDVEKCWMNFSMNWSIFFVSASPIATFEMHLQNIIQFYIYGVPLILSYGTITVNEL